MGLGHITDVPGVLVGHHHRRGRGWRTGTTVVRVDGGALAACDVRGGGPGTRETDLLDPTAMIERVQAICLSGGSAYGLAAAHGVMRWHEERQLGFPVGPEADQIVPIVPAAVIFDLGRAGNFRNRPDESFGYAACAAARNGQAATGAVGAGTGALAGGLQGGVGSASVVLADGTIVGALAVVNAGGRVIDPRSGMPHYHDGIALRRPAASERRALAEATQGPLAPLNTTIGVVATSAALTKSECRKLAGVAHDGLARAIRPVHSMFDGDTIFSLATGQHPLVADEPPGLRRTNTRPGAVNVVLAAAADCFALACTRAVIDASSIGGPPSYRELCPGAFS
ncbi:MAG TPA: P1 family peptidase [Ilumatobacteraceae bacterium]|nr:P1 family peptidase [Ilumatobacteraceae bacterium]